MRRSHFFSIGLAASCACLPFSLSAQEAAAETAAEGSSTLTEVVVTARRRGENLQDVPISIVSKSGEELERAAIASVTELSRSVPGFVFKNFEAGGASTIGLRGLATLSNQVAAQQSVGLLIDDVVLDTVGQVVGEFNDINRIEILRGPQGTLFGRNTTGGVVHLITNQPTFDFGGKASLSYGSYDEVKWNATINGPLSENVAARASAFVMNRGGYIENVYDGRMLGSDKQFGLNTKFLYTPRESTRFRLNLTYVERDQEALSSFGGQPVVGFGPATDPNDNDILVNAGLAGPHNNKINGIGSHPFEDQIAGASLIWEEDIGGMQLTSVTAWEYWEWWFGRDNRSFNPPVEPVTFVHPFAYTELKGWSQEVRLASPADRRVEYVIGAFASGATYRDKLDFLFNVSGEPDPALGIYLFTKEFTGREVLTYAAFGEADFHMTDTVTLTAGTRWTHDDVDVNTDAQAAPGYLPDIGIGIGPLGELYIPFLNSEFPGQRSGSISAGDFNWRVGARWEPTADAMLYGTVARGYKGPTISALGAYSLVRPEVATNYEAGLKMSFLGNRVTTALSVFYTDVNDFQSERSDNIETPQGTSTQIILTNAGKVHTEGVEFELSAILVDALRFDLGLAYIDAKYEEFIGASCYEGQTAQEGCLPLDPQDPDSIVVQNLSGERLPLVPKWSGVASMTYDFGVPFWSPKHFLRLDYSYQSEINWSLGLAPLNEADATGVLGLALGVRSQDQKLEVVGYIKNLTNEFVVNDLTGGNEVIRAGLLPEYQRTYGLTVNYKF